MAPFDRLRVVSKVEPQAPAGGIGTLRGWEAALQATGLFSQRGRLSPRESRTMGEESQHSENFFSNKNFILTNFFKSLIRAFTQQHIGVYWERGPQDLVKGHPKKGDWENGKSGAAAGRGEGSSGKPGA